jgi:hypothetical protein
MLGAVGLLFGFGKRDQSASAEDVEESGPAEEATTSVVASPPPAINSHKMTTRRKSVSRKKRSSSEESSVQPEDKEVGSIKIATDSSAVLVSPGTSRKSRGRGKALGDVNSPSQPQSIITTSKDSEECLVYKGKNIDDFTFVELAVIMKELNLPRGKKAEMAAKLKIFVTRESSSGDVSHHVDSTPVASVTDSVSRVVKPKDPLSAMKPESLSKATPVSRKRIAKKSIDAQDQETGEGTPAVSELKKPRKSLTASRKKTTRPADDRSRVPPSPAERGAESADVSSALAASDASSRFNEFMETDEGDLFKQLISGDKDQTDSVVAEPHEPKPVEAVQSSSAVLAISSIAPASAEPPRVIAAAAPVATIAPSPAATGDLVDIVSSKLMGALRGDVKLSDAEVAFFQSLLLNLRGSSAPLPFLGASKEGTDRVDASVAAPALKKARFAELPENEDDDSASADYQKENVHHSSGPQFSANDSRGSNVLKVKFSDPKSFDWPQPSRKYDPAPTPTASFKSGHSRHTLVVDRHASEMEVDTSDAGLVPTREFRSDHAGHTPFHRSEMPADDAVDPPVGSWAGRPSAAATPVVDRLVGDRSNSYAAADEAYPLSGRFPEVPSPVPLTARWSTGSRESVGSASDRLGVGGSSAGGRKRDAESAELDSSRYEWTLLPFLEKIIFNVSFD